MRLFTFLYAFLFSGEDTADEGQTTNYLIWFVAILAAVALIIFIVTHVSTKP